ncbi:serine/threonine protein phosphatase [Desulfitobacterium hafniense]|uniref:Serine/threonine protein phosphatase n=1 Tax=Desulfitobacterium hafniense TaxID=49338 RepID=A0A0W1JLZ6_DESHA|nr:MobP3 family relaxase [Desulfitobacterium hafniense]KTE92469.1 serine/threonine protein phosphatase [Desulfitobacterium hafniense]
MPKIIFKCRYLKNSSVHLENLVEYVATRDGVEKISPVSRDSPATQKQEMLITDILTQFPDAADVFEYEDYLKHSTAENASQFIGSVLEQNLDQLSHQEIYVNYIATRSRAEKLGTHGLFSDEEAPLVLSKVMEKVARHTGNVWTPIISLRREDAARLGYDNAAAWTALLRKQRNMFAEQMKITPENLRWFAAFHNEGHHPHCHMLIYSVNPREGYVTKFAIDKMRSCLAKEIFQQDLIQIYSEQTVQRNKLAGKSREALREIIGRMSGSLCESETIEALFANLAERLKHTSGKKQYGYLKAPLKAIVDQIVDELAKDGQVSEAYAKWHELRYEVLRTYTDKTPDPLPLSQQKEFKSIKNMVISEAMSIGSHYFTLEGDEEAEQLPDDGQEMNTENSAELLKKASVLDNSFAQYRLGKRYLLGDGVPKDAETAVKWLTASAEQGSQHAQYALGKLFLIGEDVPRDREATVRWFTLSAEQGNVYARYFLDHMNSFSNPFLFLAATRLLHHLSRIFRDEQQRLSCGTGMQTDSKLRRKIREKKIAQGHAQDDHELKHTNY